MLGLGTSRGWGEGLFRLGSIQDALSAREDAGWFSSDGGWLLYGLDKMGIALFGAAWRTVGITTLCLGIAGVIALLAHSLRTPFAPCGWRLT